MPLILGFIFQPFCVRATRRSVNVSALDAFLSARGRNSRHSLHTHADLLKTEGPHAGGSVCARNRIAFLIFDPSILIARPSLCLKPRWEKALMLFAIDISFRFLRRIVPRPHCETQFSRHPISGSMESPRANFTHSPGRMNE